MDTVNSVIHLGGHGNINSSDLANYHVTCCTDRHRPCYLTYQKLDLAILGASRQLYKEAFHILWATNTFSFDDPISFRRFISSSTLVQLHKLKSLHLSRVVEDQRSMTCGADRVINHWAWTIACEPSRIDKLWGLRTLHVSLEQWLDPCTTLTSVPGYHRRCIQQDALPILQLRILALEHVTVIVTDSPGLMESPEFRAARWSAAEKSDFAEGIRIQLLDAEGAASLRAEVDAKKLEIEGIRMDEQDRIEKRKREKLEIEGMLLDEQDRIDKRKREKVEKRKERARAKEARMAPVGREVINRHLEQQIRGTVKRSWMTQPSITSFQQKGPVQHLRFVHQRR